MFGKTLTQYLGFQKVVLVLIVLAFLVRLALSLAGTPNSVAKWISVTVVLLAVPLLSTLSVVPLLTI